MKTKQRRRSSRRFIKEFDTTAQLQAWLDYPLAKQTYKVVSVDRKKNCIEVIRTQSAVQQLVGGIGAGDTGTGGGKVLQ